MIDALSSLWPMTIHRSVTLCLPKIHLNGASALASIGPFDVEARERRKVLGVERGKHEMVRECCGVDEAMQRAHPVTQMEAFKPCQSRAGRLLCEMVDDG
jgi:hypothetical protein